MGWLICHSEVLLLHQKRCRGIVGFLAALGMTCLLVFAVPVQAHPLAPALLELRELDAGRHAVLWRTSVARARGTDVQPQLPAHCRTLSAPAVSTEDNQSLVLRWQVDCGATGLAGQPIRIRGLEHAPINVILRVQDRDGAVATTLLDRDMPVQLLPAPQTPPPVFRHYLVLGVEHLLLGLDHLLFVLGLVLLMRQRRGIAGDARGNAGAADHAHGLRSLVVTVTAFTLGHSVTLALATLGFVRINPALTELAIALSILVLALEITRPRPDSWMRTRPWLMALSFGLLHGLGFAGALAEVGLPQGEIPLALLAFNLGIELGQLLLVATILAIAWLWQRVATQALRRADGLLSVLLPSYLIGSLGAYWCIERSLSLLG